MELVATRVLRDKMSELSKNQDEKLNERLVGMSLTNAADTRSSKVFGLRVYNRKSSDNIPNAQDPIGLMMCSQTLI